MRKSIALGLSVMNLIIWGCWPLIRMNCKADGPVFLVLFSSGQWMVGMICSFIIDPYLFHNTLSITQLSSHLNIWKLMAIIVGGYCAANGDFLCTCACTRIPVAIAFPVYAGFCLVLGIILTFIIEEGEGTAPELLFPGLLFGLLAIGSLALAEANSSEALEKQHNKDRQAIELSACTTYDNPIIMDYKPVDSESISTHAIGPDSSGDRDADDDVDIEIDLNFSTHSRMGLQDVNSSSSSSREKDVVDMKLWNNHMKEILSSVSRAVDRISVWVYVCVLGGVIAALWSPLSTIGRQAPNQIDNPAALLFLFQCGSLSAMPMMLLYYGTIIIVRETQCPPVYPYHYIHAAYSLPWRDKLWGVVSGALVAIGYACYFVSSDTISPTIALGIASCEPLSTIFLGVTFAGSLKGTTETQRRFMLISSICFIVAVSFMTLSGS